MRKILFILVVLFTNYTYADNELIEKATVLGILKKYSETVACSTNFEEQESLEPFLKNVYTVERDPETGAATYYILWEGDMGCPGGSGTYSYFVSEVSRYSKSRPFLVQNNEAFGEGVAREVNPRFIETLKKIDANKFTLISSEFAENDSNNFPSIKYEYIIQRKGQWAPWIVAKKNLIQ
ncbi:hypothetical protein [Aeromonas hydrophila]|uniref:hypothetical protein n=1 Tax=Aeromonas hydrophila TaxID=644 RepID=UPI003D225543